MLSRFKQALNIIFTGVADPAAAKKQELEQSIYQHDKERLQKWLPDILGKIKTALEETEIPEGGPFKNFSYTIDVDTTQMSREDLEEIMPTILDMHETCMEKDVHIDIDGFDRLPKDGHGRNGSWSRGPSVVIRVNTDQTYDHYSHPQFTQLRGRGIETQPSTQRQRVCRL